MHIPIVRFLLYFSFYSINVPSHCSFQYMDEKITEAEQEARGPVLPIMAFTVEATPKRGTDLTSVDSDSSC